MPPVDRAPEKKSEAAEFAASAFYTGIEKPINGLLQTAEKLTTVKLPRMEIVDPHGANTLDGPNATAAEKGGAILGSVLTYAGSRIAAHYGLSKLAAPFKTAAAEGAVAGAVMGGVLTPVDEKGNFWQQKAAHAVTDAATFATLEGVGNGLKSSKTLGKIAEDGIFKSIGKGAARGAISGLPTGFINAEAQSLTSGNGLANTEEISSSMRDFALFGAALGAADGGIAKFRFRETSDPKIVDEPNKIISVDKSNKFGEGDEGAVYSNGDGTLTKVFHDKNADLSGYRQMFDTLKSLKIATPKIYEIGKTEEGFPAVRMEQIGDDNNLREQLIFRTLSDSDRAKLPDQYYGTAEKLFKAGKRIDWQLKNMKMHEGKLYIFDPSFMKDETTPRDFVDMFAGNMIGPRPEKYSH